MSSCVKETDSILSEDTQLLGNWTANEIKMLVAKPTSSSSMSINSQNKRLVEFRGDNTAKGISALFDSPTADWRYKMNKDELTLSSTLGGVVYLTVENKGNSMIWTMSDAQGIRSIKDSKGLSPAFPINYLKYTWEEIISMNMEVEFVKN